MINWDALVQAIITSGAIATAVGVVFRKYTEKRIEHVFDKKMKEYEAKLQERTELRIGIGKDRIAEYKRLSHLINSVRKEAVDLCAKLDLTAVEISGLTSKVHDLQEVIYQSSVTLHLDGIYEQLHSYKVQLGALAGIVENERKLRESGQSERANGVREIITLSVSDIQSECTSINALLVTLISKYEK